MASEIPEDIRAKALLIAKEAIYNGGVEWAADDIAEAILAERERCAKVAEDLIEQRRGLSLSFDMIAAAIRQDNPNETCAGTAQGKM